MFVPRQVQKQLPSPPPTAHKVIPPNVIPTITPPLRPKVDAAATTETKDDIDPTVAKEIVLALEMLFSECSKYADWLKQRMRSLEGRDDWVHLAALIECRFFAETKPKPSQVLFMKALVAEGSELLEISEDKYHVRRKTTSSTRIQSTDEAEACTIYAEPHINALASNPGKLAKLLTESSCIPEKFKPVKYIESGGKSWGFILFSSAVSDIDAQNKSLWPKNWIVLTKTEWRRRDTLYQELRKQEIDARHTEAHARASRNNNQSSTTTTIAADSTTNRTQKNTSTSTFEPGLIVRLTNLHPETAKATIVSFVSRSVDRFIRKKQSSKTSAAAVAAGATVPTTDYDDDEKEKEEKRLSSPPSPPPEQPTTNRSIKINYVDYNKGLSTAYIRQTTSQDSQTILQALKKRKRLMRNGEDGKGRKAMKADKELSVQGAVLEGEDERIYWEKVFAAKESGKGKGNGRKKTAAAAAAVEKTLDVRAMVGPTKRSRQLSNPNLVEVGKRVKVDG